MSETDLKPGRALDTLVAQEIMGWTIVSEYEGPLNSLMNAAEAAGWRVHRNDGPRGIPPISEEKLKLLEPGERLVPVPVPHYSIDIAAAWELVERGFVESVVKLSDGRWHARPMPPEYDEECEKEVGLRSGFSIGNGNYYEIPIYPGQDVICDSAPHAICLAARLSRRRDRADTGGYPE